MVHFIPGWGAPQPPGSPQTGGCSFLGETVVVVALNALGFLTASAFDHTNPALAAMIRLTTGGMSLIWLFGRCCPGGSSTPHVVHHHVGPVPVHVPPPQPQTSSYWNWFSLPTMRPAPVTRTYVTPIVTPHNPHGYGGGFPAVHRAPPQDSTPLYTAPESRGSGFNPTHPTGFKSHQATTTHTSGPQVQPIPQTGFGGFPSVYKAPSQQTGGFPTVHKAQPQQDPTPLFKAPESRNPTGFTQPPKQSVTHTTMPSFTPMMLDSTKSVGGFPTVHKTPPQQTGGFPTMHKMPQQTGTHSVMPKFEPPKMSSNPGGFPTVIKSQPQSGNSDNDRLLFKAAEKR